MYSLLYFPTNQLYSLDNEEEKVEKKSNATKAHRKRIKRKQVIAQ